MWPKTPPRVKPKPKAKDKGNVDFPSYDAFLASSSSQPSSSQSSDIRKMVQSLAEANKMVIPAELQSMLEDGGLTEIKTEQQALNRRKKLALKLERLKQAKTNGITQWAQYREKMAARIKEEKSKFDKDQEEIAAAIQETQIALDKLVQGGDEDLEEEEEDLSSILKDTEKEQMAKDLAQANTRNEQALQQIATMQRQLQAYAAAAAVATPMPEEKTPGTREAKDVERLARQERMRKVEEQLQKDRERSPRRESQESDIHSLGWSTRWNE